MLVVAAVAEVVGVGARRGGTGWGGAGRGWMRGGLASQGPRTLSAVLEVSLLSLHDFSYALLDWILS